MYFNNTSQFNWILASELSEKEVPTIHNRKEMDDNWTCKELVNGWYVRLCGLQKIHNGTAVHVCPLQEQIVYKLG